MNLFLPFAAALTASVSSVAIRLFEQKVQRDHRDLQVFQTLYVFLCGVVFLLVSGFRFPGTAAGWLYALAFSACLAVSSIGTAESFLCGPMSLSSVINSCSVVLPILFGCLVYQETMTLTHLLGIVFLLATFILTGTGSQEGKKEISLKWFIMVMLAFLGNGFGAVVLSAYSKIPETASNNGFMAVSFFISAVLLLTHLLLSGDCGAAERKPFKLTAPFFGLSFMAALGCFGTNLLILYLSGVMPASLLHPVYNGASGILITIISCVGLRERMTRKKAVILLLGICAVVFLNL